MSLPKDRTTFLSDDHAAPREETEKMTRFQRPSRAQPYKEFFLNYLLNVVCLRAKIRWFRPMITNFYVTKRCNLRCRYCYPVGDEPDSILDLDLQLLEKIRPHNPAINFTGGEPLLYAPLFDLIIRAKALRFFPIILSTNALLIDRMTSELSLIDHLIISLHSVDERINDALLGVPGATREIRKKIGLCALLSRVFGFHLSVHSVISPENLDGIEEIVHYCESMGITWSTSPEHGRYYPHPDLCQNKKYNDLIDRLIQLKKRSRAITCSDGYLRRIRDLPAHRCFPFVSPRVEPDGRVYLPCQRIKKRQVYLQDYASLVQLMRREADWVAAPDCTSRCYLACYVEVEQYIRNPFTILRESLIRQWISGKAKGFR
jgi:MoaA/NifB/PqqE/SkfB family radical SAM enzyme